MALITLKQAMDQIKVTDKDDQKDIQQKMEQASALVLSLCSAPDPDWSEETDPTEDAAFSSLQAAILEVFANLYRNRGDDGTLEGPITPRVVNILKAAGLYVPALA